MNAVGSPAAEHGGSERRFGPVVDGVLSGAIVLDAADGILKALGPIAGDVELSALTPVVETLARESRTAHADAAVRMAGAARDSLDRAGVGEREQQLRAKRFLRIGPERDGMRRLSGLLDPESAAIVVSAVDSVTAPRRGGPRFVDPAGRTQAEVITEDSRSVEQLALDSVVEMIRIAAEADTGMVFGTNRPAVRISLDYAELRRDLAGSAGAVAFLETSGVPVIAATARRIACDSGVLPLVFGGESEVLDIGRSRRLFTGPQRVALAERDGGCRWPGCDRPPSWTEAHHINPWSAGGRTDIGDGVLLCRHHHLLLHNNGWNVVRARGGTVGQFSLVPPGDVDPQARPRPMPPRSRGRRTEPAHGRPNQVPEFSSRAG